MVLNGTRGWSWTCNPTVIPTHPLHNLLYAAGRTQRTGGGGVQLGQGLRHASYTSDLLDSTTRDVYDYS